MDNSDLFITCYEHLQAQCQGNLIASDTLENMVEHFNVPLTNILEHSDWNFRILAYQLCSEFHTYMQFTLTHSDSQAMPVPEPINFQNSRFR